METTSLVQLLARVLSPGVMPAAAGFGHGGKGKLTLAPWLPSSSLLQMTDLFQAKEFILALKTHLDPKPVSSCSPHTSPHQGGQGTRASTSVAGGAGREPANSLY